MLLLLAFSVFISRSIVCLTALDISITQQKAIGVFSYTVRFGRCAFLIFYPPSLLSVRVFRTGAVRDARRTKAEARLNVISRR